MTLVTGGKELGGGAEVKIAQTDYSLNSAINDDVTFGFDVQIIYISTGDSSSVKDIKVYIDTGTAAFDALLLQQALSTDGWVWIPDGPLVLCSTDKLRVEIDADTGNTAPVTVVARHI